MECLLFSAYLLQVNCLGIVGFSWAFGNKNNNGNKYLRPSGGTVVGLYY